MAHKHRGNKKEIRTFKSSTPMDIRTTEDGQKVSGYAVVFNSMSADLGFREICAPGMFTRTLRENPDVLLLRDHQSELLLARTTAKTLILRQDGTGLKFSATLPNTSIGQDTAENIRLGNLSGNSFGFTVREDAWAEVDGQLIRTLLDVNLLEVSITSFPAYQATSVNLRSALATCPVGLRKKIKAEDIIDADGDDSDDDNDDDADDDECRCQCQSCEDGDCDKCDDSDCDDDNCEDCPSQTRSQHLDLLRRRLTS